MILLSPFSFKLQSLHRSRGFFFSRTGPAETLFLGCFPLAEAAGERRPLIPAVLLQLFFEGSLYRYFGREKSSRTKAEEALKLTSEFWPQLKRVDTHLPSNGFQPIQENGRLLLDSYGMHMLLSHLLAPSRPSKCILIHPYPDTTRNNFGLIRSMTDVAWW